MTKLTWTEPEYTQFYVEYWKPAPKQSTKFVLLPDGTQEKGGLRWDKNAFNSYDEAYSALVANSELDWERIELTAIADDCCKVHNINVIDLFILVSNCRNNKHDVGYINILCDRTSVLGNPFELTSESKRDAVVHAHKQWLNQVRLRPQYDISLALDAWIAQGLKVAHTFKRPTCKSVMQELDRIENLLRAGKKVSLRCWCADKACHCDNYKAYLIWKLSQ